VFVAPIGVLTDRIIHFGSSVRFHFGTNPRDLSRKIGGAEKGSFFILRKMKAIEILDIRLIESSGKSLKAFADVRFENITIRDFRVVKEDGKRPHVKVPFSTYKDQKGRIKFRPIVILPEEVRGEIDLAILNAYKREKEQENGRSLP
jgi:DNA-binding cell septation regulator SpoVG